MDYSTANGSTRLLQMQYIYLCHFSMLSNCLNEGLPIMYSKGVKSGYSHDQNLTELLVTFFDDHHKRTIFVVFTYSTDTN